MTESRERLFATEELDRELCERGRVAVPVLGPDAVQHLLDRYRELVPADETGMRIDFLRTDRALTRRLSDVLTPVLHAALADVFPDHVPVLCSFVVKHPGDDSGFYVHRDLPMNDERHHRCYSVWIPLEPVGPGLPNGGLGVVPGSPSIRAGAAGFDASVLYAPYREYFSEHLCFDDLAAGTALVYDSSMLHASPPNRHTRPRYAVGALLGRRDAPVVYVHRTGRRHRKVFEVDPAFFVDHDPLQLMTAEPPPPYSVIDEYDEVVELVPSQLRDAVGGSTVPVPRVELPPDLPAPTGDPVAPLPTVQRWHDRRRTDLVPESSRLLSSGDRLPGAEVLEVRGAVSFGSFDVEETAGMVGAMTVVVAPYGRLRLEVHRSFGRAVELVTVDGPPTRAGVMTDSAASELRPGFGLRLPDGEPVWIWSDGPGPLTLQLRRRPCLGPGPWRSSSA